METVKIAEGLNLHFTCADKFKTTVICVLIRTELRRESATLTALIPAILKSGTQRYKTRAGLNAAAEEMYGAVFDVQIVKKSEEQIIQFYIEFINKADSVTEYDGAKACTKIKEKALVFLRELMLRPLIDNGGFINEYVQCEKQNLKSGIESRVNIKSEYAKLKCVELMCKDEPFGIYADGYIEDLSDSQGIDGRKLYTHYMEILEKSPIEFYVLGSGEAEFFREQIASLFLPEIIPRKPRVPPNASFHTGNLPRSIQRYSESMDITQGKLCMGYRAGIDPASDEFIPLMIFNELLGGMANSRLFVEAREKRGLCYYINSFLYRFKSILIVQSGVDSARFDETIDLISDQIFRMASPGGIGGIRDDEFEDAKKSLEKAFMSLYDNQAAQIDYNFAMHMLDNAVDVDGIINRIQAADKSVCAKIAGILRLDTIFTLD